MPRISCPKCDARVKIPEDYDEDFIKCKTCGKRIPLGADEDDDMPARKSEKKPSGMGGCLAIGAYSITILAIIVCIVVAFIFPPAGFVMAVLVGVITAILASIAGMISWFVAMGQRRSKFMAYLPWLGLMVLGALTAATPPTLLSIGTKAGWIGDGDAGKGLAQNKDGGDKDGKDIPKVQDDGGKDKGAKIDGLAKIDKGNKDQKPPVFDKNKVEKKPLKMSGDAALDAKLNDIASPDGKRSKLAADSIAGMEPNEYRAIVAQHLMEATKAAHPTSRTPLLRALGKWGTAEEVPPLITLLTDPDINTRNETLQSLGKLKDERAAAPMVKCLLDFSTQANAETALKAMGAVAEKEVIGLLATNKGPPRLIAIRILGEIGTEMSIQALEDASKGVGARAASQKAIAAINLRLKK